MSQGEFVTGLLLYLIAVFMLLFAVVAVVKLARWIRGEVHRTSEYLFGKKEQREVLASLGDVAKRLRHEHEERIQALETAGLDELELNRARQSERQRYLKEINDAVADTGFGKGDEIA